MNSIGLNFLTIIVCILLGQTSSNETIDYCTDEMSESCFQEEEEEEYSSRLYDAELEAFLRNFLKNGSEGLGLPPLDPLVLPGTTPIALPEMSGVMLVEHMNLEDTLVIGLSNFTKNALSLALPPPKIVFDLSFDIVANARNMDFNFTIGDLIPFFGDGEMSLQINIVLSGVIEMGINSEAGGYIYISRHSIDIFFGDLNMVIENIMNVGGTKESELFNKLLSIVTPDMLNTFVDVLKGDLIDPIFDSVNNTLVEKNLTVTDLLACINPTTPSKCPIDI